MHFRLYWISIGFEFSNDNKMSVTRKKRIGSAEIASLIRRDIKTGELGAKERLPPERVLAESYSVARGTVREALNRLAEESLVEIRAGSGTYVTFDPTESPGNIILNARPLELIDARFALEPHICRLAVLHARTSDLDQLEELLQTMESSVHEPTVFSSADTAFHSLLAETTNNSLLIWVVSQMNSVRNEKEWSNMRRLILNAETITAYNLQHRAILNAIRQREPEQAALAMKAHLEGARSSLNRAADT